MFVCIAYVKAMKVLSRVIFSVRERRSLAGSLPSSDIILNFSPELLYPIILVTVFSR